MKTRGARVLLGALVLLSILACRRKGREAAPPVPPPPAPVSVVLVGDLLMHEDVKRSAAAAPRGFRSLWEAVEPLFRSADVVVGNLETPIAPRTGRPGAPFSFNAPAELARDLAGSGFHLLTVANNHAFDQGRKGLVETLEHVQGAGLGVLGGGLDQARAEAPVILERKGMRLAFLARTDLFNANLNGGPGDPHVAALDLDRTVQALRDVRSRADAVIVVLHWGNEYHLKPSPRQRQVAEALVAAGADAVVGHHPHVLQPLEPLVVGERRGVVAYSLGNFISNQDRMYDPGQHPPAAGDNRDGGALVLTFRRERPEAPVRLDQARLEGLWTDNNWRAREAGQARQVVIRTVPVGAAGVQGAEARAQAALLDLRRQRIQGVAGQTVLGPT